MMLHAPAPPMQEGRRHHHKQHHQLLTLFAPSPTTQEGHHHHEQHHALRRSLKDVSAFVPAPAHDVEVLPALPPLPAVGVALVRALTTSYFLDLGISTWW